MKAISILRIFLVTLVLVSASPLFANNLATGMILGQSMGSRGCEDDANDTILLKSVPPTSITFRASKTPRVLPGFSSVYIITSYDGENILKCLFDDTPNAFDLAENKLRNAEKFVVRLNLIREIAIKENRLINVFDIKSCIRGNKFLIQVSADEVI